MRQMIAILGVVLLVGACAGDTVPENSFYRLNVARDAAPEAVEAKLPGTLEVSRLLTPGALAQRAIVYHDADNPKRLKAYNYHFWSEPPGVLLSTELAAYLEKRGAADNVVLPELRVRPDYVIGGRVIHFERAVGNPTRAIMSIQLTVRRQADGTILLNRTYSRDLDTDGETIFDTVQAFSQASAAIFAEFRGDLAQVR